MLDRWTRRAAVRHEGGVTLADALQDAGCHEPGLLAHCRSGGPRVRGCRAVDLVLGKGYGVTEDEWRAAGDVRAMLLFLRDRASDRKLRLFACAGCLTLADVLPDEALALLDVCERYADGRAGAAELAAGRAAAKAPRATPGGLPGLQDTGSHLAVRAAVLATWVNVDGWRAAAEAALQVVAARRHTGHKQAPLELAGLLRDVVGSLPFRPVAADPSWLTPTVVGLAEAIYAERVFDRMPVLADALEEAGCDSEDVLAHCRSDGPHVRGCWVVDLLLGKE